MSHYLMENQMGMKMAKWKLICFGWRQGSADAYSGIVVSILPKKVMFRWKWKIK